MPNLKEIKTRIGSVKKTRQITSAMKLVAAAKLKVHAKAVKTLIAKEKKGDFSPANDAALLGRFRKRLKALRKGD